MATRGANGLLSLGLGLGLGLGGCGGEPHLVGLDQPIIVQGAELKHGELPGADSEDGAAITSLQLNFGVLQPGAPNVSLSGRASGEAYAVAIRILELGTGYWLKPVGAVDPTVPEDFVFDFSFQAATEIEPGNHTFAAVAFDKDGHAGPQYTIPICVVSDLPDNRNVCDPTKEPPPAIASLTWNADVDLDLTIQGPDGRTFNRSNRSLLREETIVAGLELDGSSGCLMDGRRRENFVWYEPSEAGSTWLASAELFDACGRAAVSFELTVYRSKRHGDGTFSLVAEPSVHGQLVRAQQSGGVGTPLYLTAIQF